MEHRAIFNDTTDVNDVYKLLDRIKSNTKRNKSAEQIIKDCDEISNIVTYLMKRLERSERERFSI